MKIEANTTTQDQEMLDPKTTPQAHVDAASIRLLSDPVILAKLIKKYVAPFCDCTESEIVNNCLVGKPYLTYHGELGEELGYYGVECILKAPDSDELVDVRIFIDSHNVYTFDYSFSRGMQGSDKIDLATEEPVYIGDLDHAQYSLWICIDPMEVEENTVARAMALHYCPSDDQESMERIGNLNRMILINLGSPEHGHYAGALKMLDLMLRDPMNLEEKCALLKEEYHLELTDDQKKDLEFIRAFREDYARKH